MKLRKKIFLTLGIFALIYGLYVFIFGILSYMKPVHFKGNTDTDSFFSDNYGLDRAVLIEHPKDAFQRRVEIIRSANDTLDVCCHCAKPGETTECFFAELLKAADRGVYVRIIWDGMVSGFTGEHKNIDLALRSHPNIDYREYSPASLLKPSAWNARLHDKFIIADDRLLMLGGRNIGDMYFDPPGYEGSVTNDRDAVIINTADDAEMSVISKVKGYMDELFSAKETKSFSPLKNKKLQKGIKEQERMKEISEKWEKTYPEYYLPAKSLYEVSVPTRKVSLIHNPVSDFKKEPVIGVYLTEILKKCDNVTIQTPYATANKEILKSLGEIAENKSTDYITNSLASTPNLPAFSVYQKNRDKFASSGLNIYEYQSTDSIHGKGCTADGHISVVGSYNLDDRSIYIDTESVLVIDSPEFYEEMNGELQRLKEKSAVVGPDNTYIEGTGAKTVPVPKIKNILMNIVSVFSRAFQYII